MLSAAISLRRHFRLIIDASDSFLQARRHFHADANIVFFISFFISRPISFRFQPFSHFHFFADFLSFLRHWYSRFSSAEYMMPLKASEELAIICLRHTPHDYILFSYIYYIFIEAFRHYLLILFHYFHIEPLRFDISSCIVTFFLRWFTLSHAAIGYFRHYADLRRFSFTAFIIFAITIAAIFITIFSLLPLLADFIFIVFRFSHAIISFFLSHYWWLSMISHWY